MFSSFSVRRLTSVVASIAIIAPLLAIFGPAVTPAQAQVSCTGGQQSSQSTVFSCTRGTPGGAHRPDPGYQTIRRFPDQACTDSNGNPSYRGIVQSRTTGTTLNRCLISHAGLGESLLDQGELTIDTPAPTTNFNDRFLTGAEVQFSVPEITTYVESLQQFPGATVVATPVRLAWDFGDGSTSSDLNPTHVFTTKTPDPANPDSSTVTVSVTGTWQVYLHPENEGPANPVQDLGEVTLTGQLVRPIVEVWSAQTEPRI